MDYNTRFNEIIDLQKKYGMEPRSDSYLTKMYAEGKTDESAINIVKELIAVDYIYKNTLYGEFIEDYMRELAGIIKHNYNITWTDTWEIVRFYGPDSLKLLSLECTGEKIPNKIN